MLRGLMLLCLLVVASTSAAAEDLWPKYEERCNRMLQQISARQYAELEKGFTSEMKQAVPAARLAVICTPLNDALGDMNKIMAHKQMDIPGSNNANFELWIRPEKAEKLLRVAVAFDQDDKIAGLSFTPTQETMLPEEKAAKLAEYQTRTPLALPFHGEWIVASGGSSLAQNHHAENRNQRYACDFCLVDKEGAQFRNSGRKNEDYYFTFGQPVLAPADGCVRQVIDGVEDNAPGERNPYYTPGNMVVIDHQNGEYSFLAHFKRGTIKVEVGQQVQQGEPLGLCGNSGNSTGPHIHYHLADAPLMQDGEGLPARFREITVDGKRTENALPVQGNRVSNAQVEK